MPQKKKQYITEEDQNEMYNLMNSYLQLSKNGTVTNKHADILAHRLFSQYVDKMIMGMINSRKYVFWLYPDPDELFQEARIAVLSSIHKHQWDPLKGSLFNFFTTVIIRNLKNYTTRSNKKRRDTADITAFQHAGWLTTEIPIDVDYIFEELVKLLDEYFSKNHKFRDLLRVLIDYFFIFRGERFTKREFCIYAVDKGYRAAFVNKFFTLIKYALCNNKVIKEFFTYTIIDFDDNVKNNHWMKQNIKSNKCEGE